MDRGSLASLAAVICAAGIAVAALADAGRSGSTGPTPTEPGAAAPTTAPRSIGSVSERLARLPLVERGRFAGRITARVAACGWREIDLATGAQRDPAPPGQCPLWQPGWRYGYQFEVEQSARAPIVRAIDVIAVDGRRVARIEPPATPNRGSAGTPAGRFALCLGGARPRTLLYRVGRPDGAVAACPPVAFDERFVFADGRRLLDEDGAVVLDAAGTVFPLPAGASAVIARATITAYDGDGAAAYVWRLPRALAGSRVVEVTGDSRTLVLRVHAVNAADIVVARRGADEVSYTRFGTVISAHPAPDGRHVAAVIAGVAVILDAATLAPLARLALPPGAVVADWRM